MASDLHNLAWFLHKYRGRSAEAEAVSRQAVAMRRDLLGAGHPQTLSSQRQLADILSGRGQPAAALPLYREALRVQTEVLPKGHRLTLLSAPRSRRGADRARPAVRSGPRARSRPGGGAGRDAAVAACERTSKRRWPRLAPPVRAAPPASSSRRRPLMRRLALAFVVGRRSWQRSRAPSSSPPRRPRRPFCGPASSRSSSTSSSPTRAAPSCRALTAADFEIVEDGAPQRILTFSEVALPLERRMAGAAAPRRAEVRSNRAMAEGRVYLLLLDDLFVMASRTPGVQQVAREFIGRYVQPGDLVAVTTTGGMAGTSQAFTEDMALVGRAVDRFVGKKVAVGRRRQARAGLSRPRDGSVADAPRRQHPEHLQPRRRRARRQRDRRRAARPRPYGAADGQERRPVDERRRRPPQDGRLRQRRRRHPARRRRHDRDRHRGPGHPRPGGARQRHHLRAQPARPARHGRRDDRAAGAADRADRADRRQLHPERHPEGAAVRAHDAADGRRRHRRAPPPWTPTSSRPPSRRSRRRAATTTCSATRRPTRSGTAGIGRSTSASAGLGCMPARARATPRPTIARRSRSRSRACRPSSATLLRQPLPAAGLPLAAHAVAFPAATDNVSVTIEIGAGALAFAPEGRQALQRARRGHPAGRRRRPDPWPDPGAPAADADAGGGRHGDGQGPAALASADARAGRVPAADRRARAGRRRRRIGAVRHRRARSRGRRTVDDADRRQRVVGDRGAVRLQRSRPARGRSADRRRRRALSTRPTPSAPTSS